MYITTALNTVIMGELSQWLYHKHHPWYYYYYYYLTLGVLLKYRITNNNSVSLR